MIGFCVGVHVRFHSAYGWHSDLNDNNDSYRSADVLALQSLRDDEMKSMHSSTNCWQKFIDSIRR